MFSIFFPLGPHILVTVPLSHFLGTRSVTLRGGGGQFSRHYFFKNNIRVFEKRREMFFDISFVVAVNKKPRMKSHRTCCNISNERTSPLPSLLKSRQPHLLSRTWIMTKSDAKPCMAETEMPTSFRWEYNKYREDLQDMDVEGCLILIWIFNPFVTSGTYMSHFQRVFSNPLG
jgi:hypothetical protein